MKWRPRSAHHWSLCLRRSCGFFSWKGLAKGGGESPAKIVPGRRGIPATGGSDSRSGGCVPAAANGFAGLPQPAVRKPMQEKINRATQKAVKGCLARLTSLESRRPHQPNSASSRLNVRTADLWNSSICLVSRPYFLILVLSFVAFSFSFFRMAASLQGRPVRGTLHAVVQ